MNKLSSENTFSANDNGITDAISQTQSFKLFDKLTYYYIRQTIQYQYTLIGKLVSV